MKLLSLKERGNDECIKQHTNFGLLNKVNSEGNEEGKGRLL